MCRGRAQRAAVLAIGAGRTAVRIQWPVLPYNRGSASPPANSRTERAVGRFWSRRPSDELPGVGTSPLKALHDAWGRADPARTVGAATDAAGYRPPRGQPNG